MGAFIQKLSKEDEEAAALDGGCKRERIVGVGDRARAKYKGKEEEKERGKNEEEAAASSSFVECISGRRHVIGFGSAISCDTPLV